MNCRFCGELAVGVFSLPGGCLVYPEDRFQSLCLHHAFKATPGDGIYLQEDLTTDGRFGRVRRDSMEVIGLDGRTHRWRLAGHTPRPGDDRPRSSHHLRARALLRRLFPADSVLEEVYLPGCSTDLWVDFCLPLRRLLLEVQGEQHARFVPFFHRNWLEWLLAVGRDREKRRWCGLNGISLVELPYDEGDDVWTERIRTAGVP